MYKPWSRVTGVGWRSPRGDCPQWRLRERVLARCSRRPHALERPEAEQEKSDLAKRTSPSKGVLCLRFPLWCNVQRPKRARLKSAACSSTPLAFHRSTPVAYCTPMMLHGRHDIHMTNVHRRLSCTTSLHNAGATLVERQLAARRVRHQAYRTPGNSPKNESVQRFRRAAQRTSQ